MHEFNIHDEIFVILFISYFDSDKWLAFIDHRSDYFEWVGSVRYKGVFGKVDGAGFCWSEAV